MKEKSDPAPARSDPFRELVAKVMQTPKAEVDRREKQYQKERKKHPKRGPKPS